MGCAPGRDLPMLPSVAPGAYRLGVGDEVRLITVGDDTLTGEFKVGASGKIALPLLGEDAGVRTRLPSGLAAEIRQALVKSDSRQRAVGVGRSDGLPADFRAGRGQQAGPVSVSAGHDGGDGGGGGRRLHIPGDRQLCFGGAHSGWRGHRREKRCGRTLDPAG